MGYRVKYEIGWREYKKYSSQKINKKRKLSYLFKVLLYILFPAGLIFYLLILFHSATQPTVKREDRGREAGLDFNDLKPFLLSLDPSQFNDSGLWNIKVNGEYFRIETYINPELQSYIKGLAQRSRTISCAIVVMEPDTGKVISMVDFGRVGIGNMCLRADFPAASLFKIVIASAGIEEKSLSLDKEFYFTGKRHTLYRYQLKNNIKTRYASSITFKDAFAHSINPVFGKIGIYELGKGLIEEYGERFLFNKEIQFDIPCKKSTLIVPEDEFGIAEIASGFNKKTLISPLHAVMLASAVANNGIMMKPILIKSIRDENGKEIYHGRSSVLSRVVSKKTSIKLKELMNATVKYGTCKKSFIKMIRSRRFRGFSFGAKTGSVNDMTDKFKYDWTVAYAIPPKGERSISLSVLAIHGEKLGIKAREMARLIIRHYFLHMRDKIKIHASKGYTTLEG